MNNKVLAKLQELITFYKEKDTVEGLFLTTYIRNNAKILELSVLSINTETSPVHLAEVDCEDNFKIVTTILVKKDLLFSEENEITLLKLLNSTILFEEFKQLSGKKNELIKATDNMSLASLNNEITFFDEPEITNGIKK